MRGISRRELLWLASVCAARGQTATRSEVAFVISQEPDHPVVLSMASQLIENGVFFELAEDTPADLSGYKAILYDESAIKAALARAETRRRLDAYAKAGGFVFDIREPIDGRTRPGVNPNFLIDLVASDRAYDMVTHAGLTRRHPEMKRRMLARPFDEILSGLREEMSARLATMDRWGEYTLHEWKAAKALIDSGRAEVRDELIASVRLAGSQMPEPTWADHVAGYFGTVWLADETGDRGPMERARAGLDRILRERPRTMGVLTHDGFTSDPLGLEDGDEGLGRTTSRRGVVWTESMHYYGPALGSMARATGDRKYFDEAVRLADHIVRYHLREDGLLAHCTRDGRPVAGAWGRGQTHALYGLLYLLEEMETSEPAFGRIVACLARVGEALKRHQDPDVGLWRNVIDHPAARLESSCSSGITYVYGRCVREGWLERRDYEPMLRRSWEGLRTFYWRGGMAANCRGTATGVDEAYYLARPQGWGRMPHLILAATEMERMFG